MQITPASDIKYRTQFKAYGSFEALSKKAAKREILNSKSLKEETNLMIVLC